MSGVCGSSLKCDSSVSKYAGQEYETQQFSRESKYLQLKDWWDKEASRW